MCSKTNRCTNCLKFVINITLNKIMLHLIFVFDEYCSVSLFVIEVSYPLVSVNGSYKLVRGYFCREFQIMWMKWNINLIISDENSCEIWTMNSNIPWDMTDCINYSIFFNDLILVHTDLNGFPWYSRNFYILYTWLFNFYTIQEVDHVPKCTLDK